MKAFRYAKEIYLKEYIRISGAKKKDIKKWLAIRAEAVAKYMKR